MIDISKSNVTAEEILANCPPQPVRRSLQKIRRLTDASEFQSHWL